MFLETMDHKTGEKVELNLALSMEQLAELQARAAKLLQGQNISSVRLTPWLLCVTGAVSPL